MANERPQPPVRADFRQFETVNTAWSDNDMYGHVNNAAYYRFFDTAVNRYLIEAGVLDPMSSAVVGLVVETGCRFFAPASFPEQLDIGITVPRIGTSSVRYELGVFKQGEDSAVAAGPLPPPRRIPMWSARAVVRRSRTVILQKATTGRLSRG